jgi:hypothetical protein
MEMERHSHGFDHNHHIVVAAEGGKGCLRRVGSEVVGKVRYRHSHFLGKASVGEEGDLHRKVVAEAIDNRDSVGLPK